MPTNTTKALSSQPDKNSNTASIMQREAPNVSVALWLLLVLLLASAVVVLYHDDNDDMSWKWKSTIPSSPCNVLWRWTTTTLLSSSSTSDHHHLHNVHEQDHRQQPNDNSWCTTAADCAFNGKCVKDDEETDPEATGYCFCDKGWKGPTCEVLDTLPVDPHQLGLRLPNHTSSWGGSVEYDSDTNLYHMFASEIILGCGLDEWTTNSQVIRATSKTPYGPYVKVQVVVAVWAHDTNVIRAPSGEWVLYVTARTGVKPKDCRKHKNLNGTVNSNNNRHDNTVPPKDTYMLWAPTPQGPWSSPVMVLNSTKYNSDFWKKYNRTAKCDSNLNGIILENGMLLGIWRKCETPDLLTIPHLLTAKNWKDGSTYMPHIGHPLFMLAGSGAEDPSNIWMTAVDGKDQATSSQATKTTTITTTVALHALFHDEQATRCMLGACGGVGRHVVSLLSYDTGIDGNMTIHLGAWRYSTVNAYDRHVTFSNGTVLRADTRARPHAILDHITRQPVALSTGVKETNESGYCWTVVTPLRR